MTMQKVLHPRDIYVSQEKKEEDDLPALNTM